MTATDRFKRLLADALERVCVLEEQLELAQQQLEHFRAESENGAVEAERVEAG